LKKSGSHPIIDLVAVAIANLMNFILVPIFILLTLNVEHPQVGGFIWIAFIIIIAAVVVLNIIAKQEWWTVLLPSLLAVFLILELALDYIARYNFRSTVLLGPYLLLYYVSILGMIGYSFVAQKKVGFITSGTYFLSQIAASIPISRLVMDD